MKSKLGWEDYPPPLAWIGFKELWKNKKQSKNLQLKVDPQNKTKL